MPAVSQKQQKAFAIAEHNPDELYTRNEGLKSMSKSSLSEFASTPRKGLPEYKHKKKKGGLHNMPSNSTPSSNEGPDDSSSLFK